MSDLFSPRAHYRAFGFVVLRGALAPAELDALTRESDRAIRDATGENHLVDDGGGGMAGHYVPATGERTPVSAALVRRFAPVLEELTGVPLLPAVVQHNLLFDMAGWHTDTGHAVPGAKAVAYLEEVDEGTGALRVLPGSHRLDERVVRDLLQGGVFRGDTWQAATAAVPAHAIASRPGDVIVFDEHIWHASVGGRNRHQWSAGFVLDPQCPEEELAVRNCLASQFVAGMRLDYDPTHYPWYGPGLREGCPPHWYARLEELGAVAAAAAEQWGQAAAAEAPMTSQ
ncbi:phytanoyl-CoA dioxygenase family protein [Pseudonocardia humida]|uniref:Phytanoyl-CoA dioxygenase family protein n=1 Tax=Pseudonocardia humida TaxID=2800819 RepID=A0ABT0ZX02_9PSEU|nr:phytanoyl-CoA dioxygenase family protein [Pseudonocardia humida]MCO1655269.1 phytanoyl-CoA dioxygenase family protein [Pseudonocardia humida]